MNHWIIYKDCKYCYGERNYEAYLFFGGLIAVLAVAGGGK